MVRKLLPGIVEVLISGIVI